MPYRIPTHRPSGRTRHQDYDLDSRDRMSKRFYNSIVWQHARAVQLHRHPLCHDCLAQGRTTRATTVHHVTELTDAPDLALDPTNHRSLCHACHSRLHGKSKNSNIN